MRSSDIVRRRSVQRRLWPVDFGPHPIPGSAPAFLEVAEGQEDQLLAASSVGNQPLVFSVFRST
jgi:hypothetical protein